MKRRGFLGSLCGLAAAVCLPRRFLLPQTREQFMGVVANYSVKKHGIDWAAINKTSAGYRVVEMDFIPSHPIDDSTNSIGAFREKYGLDAAWLTDVDGQHWAFGPALYPSKTLANRPEDTEIFLMLSEMHLEGLGVPERDRPKLRAMWREIWQLYSPGSSLRYPERANVEREIFKRYGQYEGGW